jgi:hypothetical protein
MPRRLQDGTEVPELDTPVILTIKTKCPEKWILIDKETGEVYTPYTTAGSLQWKKIRDNKCQILI